MNLGAEKENLPQDEVVVRPAPPPFRENLELFSRGALAFVGSCYVIGLMIVNLHLRQYGVRYIGFLHLEYVMAGALYLFLVAFVVFFLDYAYHTLTSSWRVRGKVRRALAFILSIITLGLVVNGLASVGGSDLSITKAAFWIVFLVILANIACFELLRRQTVFAWRWIKSTGELNETERPFWFFLLLGLSAGAIYMYALGVFPKYSWSIGGGKLQRVQLLPRTDKANNFQAVGLDIDPQTRRTKPFELIFETPDALVVIPPNDVASQSNNTKAIRMRKDSIDMVFYLSGEQ
jgi:hypothetical protein